MERSAARQLGNPSPRAPEPPESLGFLWARFLDLSAWRSSSGFGPALLTASDVLAWSVLTGFSFTPAELRLLAVLDRTYVSAMNKLQEDLRPKPPAKSAGGTPRIRKR